MDHRLEHEILRLRGESHRSGCRKGRDASLTSARSSSTPEPFEKSCKILDRRYICTKSYTPGTNGKAKHSIQTALRKWAYADANGTLQQRTADLPVWIHQRQGLDPASEVRRGLDSDRRLLHRSPRREGSRDKYGLHSPASASLSRS